MGRLTADLQISAFVNKHVKYTRNVQLSDVIQYSGNDSNLLIVFYVQIMPDDLVMQLHRF